MAWDEWPWVISVDEGSDAWDNSRATDQTLWTLCEAFDVSVVGIDLGIPTPKRSIIDVPYRNGSLILTSDNEVTYASRRISMRFETHGTLFYGYAAIRAFSEAFHGKTGYIYKKPGTPDFGYTPFFHGTMEVSKFDLNGSTFSFSINMEAFPYCFGFAMTEETVEVYDTTFNLPDISVLSKDYHMLVSVAFDPDYPTDGVILRGNYATYTATIPWGAGSSSPFNANMFMPKPLLINSNYVFKSSIGPLTNRGAGVLNCKVTIRRQLCQL